LRLTTSLQRPVLLLFRTNLLKVNKKNYRRTLSEEENIKFLLNNQVDVEYILHSSEQFPDFSVILLPENLVFPIQDYTLSSEEELYQIIQYYE
jgi:hypothetical protein